MNHRRIAVLVAGVTALVGVTAGAARAASDYSNAAYLAHDLDNVTRATARQTSELSDPSYGAALLKTGMYSWVDAQRNQLADLNVGRVHASLGQFLPAGAVGDPKSYFDITPARIQFLSRTGAKLSGRIWSNGAPGPRPGIVITTGSIQATEHMYWWAARTLAAAGYVVMTWDVQGQGESEATGHHFGVALPTTDGVPFQQSANFYDGTIDALRFFTSTPAGPYVPGGRSQSEVNAAKATARAAQEHLDWVNPAYAAFDRAHIGLAGHSLGAGAVSAAQQCSDQSTKWKTIALCGGRSFPIRAVVAWDQLSSSVAPVVPAMNQQADGYFLYPQPASTAPDPDAHLSAHRAWKKARIDTYSLTIRGGTHLEWSEIPYLLPATVYGTALANYYTLAWFDRYVMGDAGALPRLLDPARAHYFSTRFRSAFFLGGRERIDLRSYAGLSAVGDWAGSNADRAGRVLP